MHLPQITQPSCKSFELGARIMSAFIAGHADVYLILFKSRMLPNINHTPHILIIMRLYKLSKYQKEHYKAEECVKNENCETSDSSANLNATAEQTCEQPNARK